MKYRDTALNLVKNAFANKKDKAGKPYVDHLLRVEDKSLKIYKKIHGSSSDIEDHISCVALLHDIIEDCPEWNENLLGQVFPSRIIDCVLILTRTEGIEYIDYIKNINTDTFCTIVKTADLEDNMDITRLETISEKDIFRIQKYHKAYRILNPFKSF